MHYFFRIFILVFTLSHAAFAQKHIFMLHWQKDGRTVIGETFLKYMKERNLDVKITERFANQSLDRLREYIAEAKKVRPDLVYVYSTSATLNTVGPYDAVDPEKHITDIPVIMAASSAPVKTKIVRKIGVGTGRNLTGVSHLIPADVTLNILNSFKRGIKTVVTISSAEPNSVSTNTDLKNEGKKYGINTEIVMFKTKGNKIIDGNIEETILKALSFKPDVIVLTSDGQNHSNIKEIMAMLNKHKSIHAAPTFTILEDLVAQTGTSTFAYFTSFAVMGLMAAAKAEEILFKGKKVQDVPYETGRQITLAIGQKTMLDFKTFPRLGFLETAEILQ